MKAQELIDILALNPEGEVEVVQCHYDGSEDVYDFEEPQVVTDGYTFVITPKNTADRYAAVLYLTDFRQKYPDQKKVESTDPVIYTD